MRLPRLRRRRPAPDPLACQEFVELATEHLEGALPEEIEQAVREHLDLCDPCVVYLEQLRSTATVLRPQSDEVLMTDGPFAEGKEQIGGLSIIRAEDLDAALDWGRKLALATTLTIEVRPFQDDPEH